MNDQSRSSVWPGRTTRCRARAGVGFSTWAVSSSGPRPMTSRLRSAPTTPVMPSYAPTEEGWSARSATRKAERAPLRRLSQSPAPCSGAPAAAVRVSRQVPAWASPIEPYWGPPSPARASRHRPAARAGSGGATGGDLVERPAVERQPASAASASVRLRKPAMPSYASTDAGGGQAGRGGVWGGEAHRDPQAAVEGDELDRADGEQLRADGLPGDAQGEVPAARRPGRPAVPLVDQRGGAQRGARPGPADQRGTRGSRSPR